MLDYSTVSVLIKDKKRIEKFAKDSGLSQKAYLSKILDLLQESGQQNPHYFYGVNASEDLPEILKNIEGLKKMIRAIERDNLKPIFQQLYKTSDNVDRKMDNLEDLDSKLEKLEMLESIQNGLYNTYASVKKATEKIDKLNGFMEDKLVKYFNSQAEMVKEIRNQSKENAALLNALNAKIEAMNNKKGFFG